jgi:hypothetical protein
MLRRVRDTSPVNTFNINGAPMVAPISFTPELLANIRYRFEETDEPRAAIAADAKIHPVTLWKIAKRERWRLRKDRPPRGLPADLQLSLKADRALREAEATTPLPSPPPQWGREHAAASGEVLPGRASELVAASADDAIEKGGREQAAARGEEPESHSPREAAARDDPSIHRAEELEREIDGLLADVKRARALGPLSSADAERTARTLERLTDTLFKVQRLRSVEAGATATDDFDDIPQDIDEFRHALARRIEAFVESWSDAGLPEQGEPSDRASA